MSSAGTRERELPVELDVPAVTHGISSPGPTSRKVLYRGKQITVSESHRRNPRTGNYDGGGPFFTCRVSGFISPGGVSKARYPALDNYYSGPVLGAFPTLTEMSKLGSKNTSLNYEDSNESSLKADGTTAISLCSPTNPVSDLGTTLAESFREGVPSLPGIQSWKNRTSAAKAAGSEYLNAEFGWLPLVSEIGDVVEAVRFHRTIMNNYHNGEGRNTHRTFTFPSKYERSSFTAEGASWPLSVGLDSHYVASGDPSSRRTVSRVRETKRWFEGCFTYGLPSSTDSWRRAIGFGSQADQLFGLSLNPDIVWELTPWSWAVDWFTNTGDVINNVTNFGLAGLVLRYGYMMEESIETITAEHSRQVFFSKSGNDQSVRTISTPCSCGYEIVTKRRTPASPFGFSIGWEGLSPTQLAITAALGITRLL